MYGPSPHALAPGADSSLYRWHVANDWRLWQETEVASLDTHSQLFPSDGGELPHATRSLAHLLASGDGRWNMNLLVDLRDGTRRVY